MDEYISREAAVDAGYLSDWYISSVGDEPPVWTDAHIDELLNDFIVIPKDTKAADVQPVKRGKWLHINDDGIVFCSECEHEAYWDTDYGQQLFDYCPYCGADMRGDTQESISKKLYRKRKTDY